MSDDFHRPTYTSPDVHGAYNATQVRLYGVPGPGFLPPAEKARAHAADSDADKVRVATGYVEEDDLALAIMQGRTSTGLDANATISKMRKGFGNALRPVQSSFVFIQSVISRYMIMLGAIDIGGDQSRQLSAGIIFGYSYEGHCYDLPKPKIMLIPAPPLPIIPPDDCGFDLKKDAGYKVWIVDKLDQCIELEVNQGFIEQLVLEANLPGKRSPTMYAGRMQLGHRSGRLSE